MAIHPGPFQIEPNHPSAFAGKFLLRANAGPAAAGDFARRVVEHVGRAFGESLQTATLLSRCGSVSVQRRIVAGAWDFERINRRYARHLKILGERPGGALRNDEAANALRRWGAAECEAWLEAVTNDPLLPGRILPSDYLGQQAWRRRVEVLRDASRQLRTFKPE
jgi:DNA-binding transcriptional regulator PaaX